MAASYNAQEDIYKLYHNKVFGYVMNKVHSKADAEDITSEVFLKIFSRADKFDLKREGASTYIFRTMQTTLTDFYRKKHIVCSSLEEITYEEKPTENLDPLLEALSEAMNILPQREWDIVVLHYYHGLSHKKIAERMQLSYVNVRQLCHVALKKLKKEMMNIL